MIVDVFPEANTWWVHFKGDKYECLGTCFDHEGDVLVMYRASKDGPTFTRPLGNFLGLAPKGSGRKFRFVPAFLPPKDEA